tara:strand:- start:905 stop:1252 length:348 start_codon:yes stop_codon:yes gene_type:complete
MDLYTTLQQQGSPYSYGDANGPTPGQPLTQLVTKQSQLHADGAAGYSLDGSDFSNVNNDYQQYNDGIVNFLPQPSGLDINGTVPSSPLWDAGINHINNSFINGTYKNSGPSGGHY